MVLNNLLSIIPEMIVDPLSEQLKWWLRSECIQSWHVKIINKANTLLFSIFWLIFVLGSSFEVTLNNFLSVG